MVAAHVLCNHKFSPLFSGTTRDLLRWAERQPDSYESLAIHGYLLIAERLRDVEEKRVVLDVLQVRSLGSCCAHYHCLHLVCALSQRHCRVTLRVEDIYAAGAKDAEGDASSRGAGIARPAKRAREQLASSSNHHVAEEDSLGHFSEWPKNVLVSRLSGRLENLARDLLNAENEDVGSQRPAVADAPDSDIRSRARACGLTTISVTKSLQRLYAIVVQCLAHDEPVLLVGDTGCGKTTVVQVSGQQLYHCDISSQ